LGTSIKISAVEQKLKEVATSVMAVNNKGRESGAPHPFN